MKGRAKQGLLEVKNNHKILEIGTGSGYQCAILSKLARRIYTIERIKSLCEKSCKIFEELKLSNIVSKYEDGNNGWLEQIPFDRIIFTVSKLEIKKSKRVFFLRFWHPPENQNSKFISCLPVSQFPQLFFVCGSLW